MYHIVPTVTPSSLSPPPMNRGLKAETYFVAHESFATLSTPAEREKENNDTTSSIVIS